MPDSAIVSQMTPTELTSKRKIDSLLNKMQFLTPEKYAILVDELLALITSPMSLLTLVDEVLPSRLDNYEIAAPDTPPGRESDSLSYSPTGSVQLP